MKNQGFSLFELILTLTICSLILALGIPAFTQQLQKSTTETATFTLVDAITYTRSLAIMRNQRSLMLAGGDWRQGWQIAMDSNENGIIDADEPVLAESRGISGVTITGNGTVARYFSFIGTGEGRSASPNGGSFLAGTLKICPLKPGSGYKLVLARGGRLRMAKLNASECGY